MPATIDPHAHLDKPRQFIARRVEWLRQSLAGWLGLVGARLLTPRSLLVPRVRATLWRRGIAAQPKGFYASTTDPADGMRRVPSSLLDLQPARQRDFAQACAAFAGEYAGLLRDRPSDFVTRPRFYLRNDAFVNLDPLLYWGIIRTCRPNRVVEIGSGFSTLLALDAVSANGSGRVEAIDPYPRRFIRDRADLHLTSAPVEHISPELLLSLAANDIVFVDSSHVVRQGGDVTWFFLDILPRLAAGVLVHIHDIHLPFDYPRELMRDRNVYWTEQYLLQAYLAKNSTDEILVSSQALAEACPDLCRQVFGVADKPEGGSFWMRIGPRPVLQ